MHHIKGFLKTCPFHVATNETKATAELAPHLAALNLDSRTPIVEIIAADGGGASWQHALEKEYDVYLAMLFAANADRIRKMPHDSGRGAWDRFRRGVSLDSAFRNGMWDGCLAAEQNVVHLPLMGKPSVLETKTATTTTTTTRGQSEPPETAAADCIAVLLREEDYATAKLESRYRETRLRPAITCGRDIDAAIETMTKEQLPNPLETGLHPLTRLEEACTKLLHALDQLVQGMEETDDGEDAIQRFVQHCRNKVDNYKAKYKQDEKVELATSLVVREAALSIMQRGAFTETIRALQLAQLAYTSVPQPPRCLPIEREHLEETRTALAADIKRFHSLRVTDVADVDAKHVETTRNDAFKAAMHLDLASFLEVLARQCTEYANSFDKGALDTQTAREFLRKTIKNATIKQYANIERTAAQEVASIDVDAIQPTFDVCLTALKRWKAVVDIDATERKASSSSGSAGAGASSGDWFQPWMQIGVPVGAVQRLQSDLAFNVKRAQELLLGESLLDAEYAKCLKGGLRLVDARDKEKRTVAVNALLRRLLPWVGIFHTLDCIERDVSRKRR